MDEHLNSLRSLHDLKKRYENVRVVLERQANESEEAYQEAKRYINTSLDDLLSLSNKYVSDLKQLQSFLEELYVLMLVIKSFSVWCDNQKFANFEVQPEENPDVLALTNPNNV